MNHLIFFFDRKPRMNIYEPLDFGKPKNQNKSVICKQQMWHLLPYTTYGKITTLLSSLKETTKGLHNNNK